MSQKANAKKAAYAKKQEEEGKKVVKWIFAILFILAIIFIVWTTVMFG